MSTLLTLNRWWREFLLLTSRKNYSIVKGGTMSKVDELKTEIESLPKEEFSELVRWLSEKDWETWNKELEADSEAGKLDFLVREALDAKAKRTLKDL